MRAFASRSWPCLCHIELPLRCTRSSAIAEGPRDASCQLISCQLPRNSAETACTTSPEEIEVMKLEGYSGPMCNKHVHSTMTRSSRLDCLIGVINKSLLYLRRPTSKVREGKEGRGWASPHPVFWPRTAPVCP